MTNPSNTYGVAAVLFQPIDGALFGSFSPASVTINAGGESMLVKNSHGLPAEAFQKAGEGELSIEGLNDLPAAGRAILCGGKIVTDTLNTTPVLSRMEPAEKFGKTNSLMAAGGLTLKAGVYRAVAESSGATATFQIYRLISPNVNTASNFFSQAGEQFGTTAAVTMAGGDTTIAAGDAGIFSVLPPTSDERIQVVKGGALQPNLFRVWLLSATGRQVNPDNQNLEMIEVPRFLPQQSENAWTSEEVHTMTVAGKMLYDAEIGGIFTAYSNYGI